MARDSAPGIPDAPARGQACAQLRVMEPIFEADLEPTAYGYRPGRSGIDAVKEVHRLLCQGFTDVVDVTDAQQPQDMGVSPREKLCLRLDA
jgi:RNA-directed DNA polymerase